MNAEDLYKKIVNRKDLMDIPIAIISKVTIVVIEEVLNLAKENSHVEKYNPNPKGACVG